MNSLNLNEFLRYMAAGAVPPLYIITGFNEPLAYVMSENISGLVWAGAVFVFLLLGATAYSVYRSLIYPVFLSFTGWMAGRNMTASTMDIQRWRNLERPGNIQKYLSEWGSQVHFMYISSILGILTLSFARLDGFTASGSYNYLLIVSALTLFAAIVSHCRLHSREAEAFKNDGSIDDP